MTPSNLRDGVPSTVFSIELRLQISFVKVGDNCIDIGVRAMLFVENNVAAKDGSLPIWAEGGYECLNEGARFAWNSFQADGSGELSGGEEFVTEGERQLRFERLG